jgi:hypothetical protein
MRVASAFICKYSDKILGFRALGFEADQQMTPTLDHRGFVEESQCLLCRPLKLTIYPAAVTASSITTLRHFHSSEDSSTLASSQRSNNGGALTIGSLRPQVTD